MVEITIEPIKAVPACKARQRYAINKNGELQRLHRTIWDMWNDGVVIMPSLIKKKLGFASNTYNDVVLTPSAKTRDNCFWKEVQS